MKFCDSCEARMDKETSAEKIIHRCKSCGFITDGTKEDTLMFEEYVEVGAESNSAKYEDFIKNSAHDTAGYKIKQQCPKCKSPFMTLMRIGERQTTMYTCTCGHMQSYGDT